MITMTTDICVDVPVETAWRQMARIDEVHLWAQVLVDSYCTSEQTRGLGAERACTLRNGMMVTERFTHWEEGKAFTYEIVDGGPAIMKTAKNEWTLTPKGENKTLIRTHATLQCKGGRLARLIEPLVLWGFKRDMPNIAASLKYFVETGKAYDGPAKELPRAPSFC